MIKKKYHIIIVILLILIFLVEVARVGMISAIAGCVGTIMSSFYLYHLARNSKPIGFSLVLLLLIGFIYFLSKSYLHYGLSQYVNGEYEGNPHAHRIWEYDHLH